MVQGTKTIPSLSMFLNLCYQRFKILRQNEGGKRIAVLENKI